MRAAPPLLGLVLKKVAPRIGAKVVLEPKWRFVGQITFKGGQRRYFRYSSLDLNPLGSSEIAKDKDYSNFFMERMGYPVVPGSRVFCSPKWAKAITGKERAFAEATQHAQEIGFPVIVKPNSGSQGTGVQLVHSPKTLTRALKEIFEYDRMALVQRPVAGKDYRVVVLDGEVISAYQRLPLSVVGDGRSTIAGLLRAKQASFVRAGRDTLLDPKDPRIKEKLLRQGMRMSSMPPKGATIPLLDNANLSSGGDSVDVTGQLHPEFVRHAVQLTKDMGLRLCGVDLMVDGDISAAPAQWWVLEINSAPGLDHYAKSGRAQARIVEELYLKVLKRMDPDNFAVGNERC